MQPTWLECLAGELQARGYGEKRQKVLLDRFEGLRESFVKQGATDPETLAASQVLSETELATREKNRRAYDTLLKRTALSNHLSRFDYNTAIVGASNEKASPASAALALLTPDARNKSGLNVENLEGAYRQQLLGAMGDIVDKAGKGVFGYQKGKAYLDNLVDEIFGKTTGDDVSKTLAKAWNKTAALTVDLWNHAGGTMHKMDNWGLPQLQSLVKVLKNGGKEGATWIADHMTWLDWDRMRHPNGAPIKPEERADILKAVWQTLSSDGRVKINPDKFGGEGHAMGNLVDQHRFLIYKDGQAWKDQHAKYGDGSVLDVMLSYVDSMSHKMGLLRVFGNSPEQMMKVLNGMVLQRAQAMGDNGAKVAGSIMARKFEPLAEHHLRANAMDPESVTANAIIGTGNVLNAAQLAGAALVAMPGDFATTMIMRAFNKLPVLTGFVDYFKLLSPTEMSRFSLQSGFIIDEMVHTMHTTSRFSGLAEYGPAVTKKLADVTMRASLMNVHTNAARQVNVKEMMSALASVKDTAFDDVMFKPMMERYGIAAKDWDAMRKVPLWAWREGVELMRPSSILEHGGSGKQDVYERFQSMILQESRYMVPNSTAEASITLKGNLRPDSLPGALLHSFAMYKNFPITMALMYGRVAMSIPGREGRLAFTASLGASLLLAGAVGMQLREMSKGRDPLAMNAPSFWGKAALASGAMSIWGDFIFNGVNKAGGPADMAAGPIVSFAGDTSQLVFGKMFDWADKVGTLKADKESKTPWTGTAVEYASRYTPGTSLWYARTALQRELFDPLRAIADPRGISKMNRKERQRVKDFGNESWWAPNERLPHRPPGLPVGVP